jgi:hypothetical protein
MERGEKKKKKKEDDEFRWTPEDADGPEDPEHDAEPDVSHIDFLSAEGPLRLVSVIDEFGETVEMYYEIPPDEAVIWVEWHKRQLARMAFALAE